LESGQVVSRLFRESGRNGVASLAWDIGAPGDFPPCIRQRLFFIAGGRHGLPLRVYAPHRGLWCIAEVSDETPARCIASRIAMRINWRQ